MDINTLKDKVINAEQKVEKCKATIERHNNQLAKKIDKFNKLANEEGLNDYDYYDTVYTLRSDISNIEDTSKQDEIMWAYSEIDMKLDDIKTAEKKLEDAENVLNNWIEKLNKEEANQQYINNEIPQVIIDFLNEWKEHCKEFVLSMTKDYRQDKIELDDTINTYYWEYIIDNKDKFDYLFSNYNNVETYNSNVNYRYYVSSFKDVREVEDKYKIKELKNDFNNKYKNSFVQFYISHNEDENALDKELEKEKNNKLLDLMNRITSITGVIANATDLTISSSGDINGVIEGEKGNCIVNTIGAGGYNIQCFHYRVLVRKV